MRIALCVITAALLALPTYPSAAYPVLAQEASRRINGYEVSGRVLEEWSRHGSEQASVYVNGLPITPRRPEISTEDGKTYDMQWFERARFELHPTNKKPYDVLLGRLGAWAVEGRGKVDPRTGKAATPADEPFVRVEQPAIPAPDRAWFAETGHTLSSTFLIYWYRNGGLAQFGYPLSEPFQEVSQADGKSYLVQYFERNRFEWHPEKAGTPYEVELGLLGVEQHRMTPVPADELTVAPPKGVRTSRDVIRIGSAHEPQNLTIFNNAAITARLRSLIEDGLTARDDNGNLFPKLAWYVPTLENGGARFVGSGEDRYLAVKYKLRQGIKWSDGVEVTSHDAIYLWSLIMHPEAPVISRSEYQKLQNVDNPGKYTVVYNYRSLNQLKAYYNSLPDPQHYGFLKVYIDQKKPASSLTYSEIGGIYPRHVLQDMNPKLMPESSFATAPVGTGPWRVQAWTRRQEMVLVRNEHYNLTAPPLINTIHIKFITDLNRLLVQARIGELDMILSETLDGIIPDQGDQRAPGPGLNIARGPGHIWEHLSFLMDFGPFQEKAVREAIIRAINRERLSQVVFRGTAAIANSVVPSDFRYSLENPSFARTYPEVAAQYKLPEYPYNPERAARLLEDAGWKCPAGTAGRDCNGQARVKGDMTLSFIYGSYTRADRQHIQVLVAQDLRAIGVNAIARSYNLVFTNPPSPGPFRDGTVKLAQSGWLSNQDDDFGRWICGYDYYWQPEHYGPLWSCLFDGELVKANDTFNTETDLRVQVSAGAQAQVILMREVTLVPLLLRPNIEIVPRNLANYKLPKGGLSSFWNARQWYFR